MSNVELEPMIIGAIASICKTDPGSVNRNTRLFELGVDSLGLASLAAYTQASLGRQLSQGQVQRMYRADTVQDLLEALADGP